MIPGMARKLVYGVQNIGLHDREGGLHAVKRNQPWDGDDPLVKLHPGFFAAEPPDVAHTTPTKAEIDRFEAAGNRYGGPRPVEAATKAPGERR